MMAFVARPADSEPRAGLLVFQEAYGVNAHIRNVTERFAREGYVAVAPELFHRTAPPGFEGEYGNFASVTPHYQPLTNGAIAQDIAVTYEWLRSRDQVHAPNISSVGFCLGGRASFLANTIVPLKSAVSFYGGGIAPALLDSAARLHAPQLLIWGGLDKHIPPEQRKAVTDALTANGKVYVNAEFSNADHGFFCDERSSYNPVAARQAWALTLEFLRS